MTESKLNNVNEHVLFSKLIHGSPTNEELKQILMILFHHLPDHIMVSSEDEEKRDGLIGSLMGNEHNYVSNNDEEEYTNHFNELSEHLVEKLKYMRKTQCDKFEIGLRLLKDCTSKQYLLYKSFQEPPQFMFGEIWEEEDVGPINKKRVDDFCRAFDELTSTPGKTIELSLSIYSSDDDYYKGKRMDYVSSVSPVTSQQKKYNSYWSYLLSTVFEWQDDGNLSLVLTT